MGVKMFLDAVLELQEMQKGKHYCAYLSGNLTAEIKNYKHDQLENFGIGKENFRRCSKGKGLCTRDRQFAEHCSVECESRR